MITERTFLRACGILAVALLIVGLCTGLALRLYGHHRLSRELERFRAEVGPLDPATYARPRIPEKDNAAVWLRAGSQAVVVGEKERMLLPLASEPASRWTADDARRVGEILEVNRPALTLLDRAAPLKASSFDIPYGDGMEARLPDLLRLLDAAKLVAMRGRVEQMHGDLLASVGSAGTLAAMTAAAEREPLLITLLVGSAIERIQMALVRDLLADSRLDGPALKGLRDTLAEEDLPKAYRSSLGFEGAAALRDLRRHRLDRPMSRWVRALAWAGGDYDAARLLNRSRRITARLTAPFVEAWPTHERIALERSWLPWLVTRDVTALVVGSGRMSGTNSVRRLARVAIAVRLAALEKGAYPVSLEGFPEASERDPLTGGKIAYETRPDGSVRLTLPGAEKLWYDDIAPKSASAPFTWDLPPAPAQRPVTAKR